jgi:type IV pilus assembly protein PilX
MRNPADAQRQDRGSVLVIGMLTLVLLSLIGLSSTTSSRIESEISGNDKVHKESFFAAELGLTSGETVIEALLTRMALNEGSTPGHYGQGAEPDWYALQWDDTDTVEVPSTALPSGLTHVAAPPRYTLEQRNFKRDSLTVGIGVPTGVYNFNVSARGTGSNANTETVLQTIYAKRFN